MSIKLKGTTAGSAVILAAPADTSPTGTEKTFTLPTQDGDAGQILKTDGSGALSFTDNLSSGRNLIINGAMQVAQRGTSTSGTGGGYKAVDRFRYTRSGFTPSLAFSQETDGPDGFANSFKIAVNTASSVGAGDYAEWRQHIEAQNLQHLGYGSASAKALTLSFYVKSNVTGTYSVALTQDDSSRRQSATYTVSSSGTWEYKTITIAGDASGTINNDNGSGLTLRYALSAGSNYTSGSTGTWSTTTANQYAGHAVDLLGTNSNYWQITGIQLEVGEAATSFEHRSFGDELRRCQRYRYQIDLGTNSLVSHIVLARFSAGSGVAYAGRQLPVEMRANPNFSFTGATLGSAGYAGNPVLNRATKSFFDIKSTNHVAANGILFLRTSSSSGSVLVLNLDAEL